MSSASVSTWGSRYNLFYLFFFIIWTPIQRLYLHVDGAGRMIMILSIIAVVSNISSFISTKKIFNSSAFVCWTLLIVYSMVNSAIKGFSSEYGLLEFYRSNYLDLYVLLMVSIVEFVRDKYRCLHIVLYALLLYIVLGTMHLNIEIGERASVEELGNALPTRAAACAFFASVLYREKKLKGDLVVLFSIIAFALFIIIVSGTRKALGVLGLVLVGLILSNTKKLDFSKVFFISISFLALYFGLRLIFDSTLIGERIVTSSDHFDVTLVNNKTINKILMVLLADRAMQYYIAISLLYIYPITGIGLLNFMEIGQFEYRLHSEYMTQLCENGIIGFSLLVLFYFFMIRGFIIKRKQGSNVSMYLFGLFAILFLNFTSWSYNMDYIMIIYALFMTEIYSSINKKAPKYQ